MTPQPEQHVRCIFRNGTLIEGIVKEWQPSGAQLQSLNDESILIIPHPDQDIILIKVLPKSFNKNAEEEKLTSI